MNDSPDPWSSGSSDSPEREAARAAARGRSCLHARSDFGPLFRAVIALVILADQLSKSWFVYTLGNHPARGFGEFLSGYWRHFAPFASKQGLVVSHYLPFKEPVDVLGVWVQWHLTTNTGAAWSMFSGNSLALSGVSIGIATLLYFIWRRSFRPVRSMSLACGAIIGGALGNFIDRFRMHEVVDFIAVKIPYIGKLFPKLGDPYDFPIFNVADACAVCGTIALTLYLIILDHHHHRHGSLAATPTGDFVQTARTQVPGLSSQAAATEAELLREAGRATASVSQPQAGKPVEEATTERSEPCSTVIEERCASGPAAASTDVPQA